MSFYTYLHTRLSDNKIFYVGKGKDLRAWNFNGRSKWWRHVVEKHGIKVDIAAIWETEKEAFEHEKFLISSLRILNLPLVNICDGGEGATGRKHSDEWKAAMSERTKGRPGKPVSEETKRKISEALKGRSFNVGIKRSKEHMGKNAASRIANSKKFSEGGFSLSTREWAKKLGMHYSSVKYRLKVGKPLLSQKYGLKEEVMCI